MKKILSIAAITVLTVGLLYNLQYALNGYSNDGIAYADPATTAASTGYTSTPGNCSITVSGQVGTTVTVAGASVKIGSSGSGTITISGASNTCSIGGPSATCTSMTCGQFWIAMAGH